MLDVFKFLSQATALHRGALLRQSPAEQSLRASGSWERVSQFSQCVAPGGERVLVHASTYKRVQEAQFGLRLFKKKKKDLRLDGGLGLENGSERS